MKQWKSSPLIAGVVFLSAVSNIFASLPNETSWAQNVTQNPSIQILGPSGGGHPQTPAQQQTPAAQQNPADQAAVIKVTSQMTLVPVRVIDHSGKSLMDLNKGDFTLFENGKQQAITFFDTGDLGYNLVLVLDVSGSMQLPTKHGGTRLSDSIAAAHHFVDILKPNDRIAIVAFSNTADVKQGFTNDRNLLHQRLDELKPTNDTRLYDTLVRTMDLMLAPLEGQKRALVVLTDGDDNASQNSLERVIGVAQTEGVFIYAIDLNSEPNQALATIAQESGAAYFKGQDTDNLHGIYDQITESLRDTYTLGYYSDSSDPRNWRAIKVSVDRSNVSIQARSGYCPSEACRKEMEGPSGPPPTNAKEASEAIGKYHVDVSMGPAQVRMKKKFILTQDHPVFIIQEDKVDVGDSVDRNENFCLLERSQRDWGSDIAVNSKQNWIVSDPKAEVRNPFSDDQGRGDKNYWASVIGITLKTEDGSQVLSASCFWPKKLPNHSSYPQMFEMLSPLLQPVQGQ